MEAPANVVSREEFMTAIEDVSARMDALMTTMSQLVQGTAPTTTGDERGSRSGRHTVPGADQGRTDHVPNTGGVQDWPQRRFGSSVGDATRENAHEKKQEEEEGCASSPPGATETSQAKGGATPRNPSHRRRRAEDDTGPITIDGVMPQKRFYRARAHVNPLSHNDCFEYPNTPRDMDWSVHFPNRPDLKVSIVDIGCGFGGLTVALSELFPDKGVLGMEIRMKVCEFVRLRVEALRKEHPGQYQNVSALRTNSMLLLPHFLERHELEKMFFCFPDPHFKAKNHRRRIISGPLLTEYAFFLRPGGLLYMITDVEELHQWHVQKAGAHPCFRPVPREEAERDPAVQAMKAVTEEGKKVARMGGEKYWAVFRRIPDEDVPYSIFGDGC